MKRLDELRSPRTTKSVSIRATSAGLLAPVNQSKNPRRFLIVSGGGRTGSHLLVNLLDQHPGIRCDAEVLERPFRWPTIEVSGRGLLAKHGGASVYGFKVFWRQVTVVQSLDAKRWFRQLSSSGWTIFHLRRANLLHQAISAQRAWKTQYHFAVGDAPDFEPMEADPVAVVATMAFIEDDLRRTYDALDHLDVVDLVYERDLATENLQRRTLHRICNLLGVEPVWNPSQLAKVQPNTATEMLSNYDEVADVIGRTRYARYLSDVSLEAPAFGKPDFPSSPAS